MSALTKILLVDDDPVILRLLEKALISEAVYQIRTARDGVKGLSEALSFRPDLILSDKVMPNMDGIELCRRVKANPQLSSTLFVVLSSMGDPEAGAEAFQSGADAYLVKPMPLEEVKARVRNLLNARNPAANEGPMADSAAGATAPVAQLVRLLIHLEDLIKPGAANRSTQMASAAGWMAESLGVAEKDRPHLELAAYLQGLGALALPPLSSGFDAPSFPPSDWEVYRTYPGLSHLLLRHVEAFQPAGAMIRHLLENWDGSGFPDHLQQTQIPLASRILRVLTDFFNDPEKIAQQESRAVLLNQMAERAGLLYDPAVFQSLLEFIEHELVGTLACARRYIPVEELRPGMKLAADLVAPSGRPLLRENEVLSSAEIAGILRFHAMDPFVFNVCVYPGPEPSK